MKRYLTGNEVIAKYPIPEFQLVELVQAGLTPLDPRDKKALLVISEDQYDYLHEKGEVPQAVRSITTIINAAYETLIRKNMNLGDAIFMPDLTEHPCLVLSDGADTYHRLLEFVYEEEELNRVLKYQATNTDSASTGTPKKIKVKPRGEVTQKEAAKLCGVSVSTIYRWENGFNTPPGYPGRTKAVPFRRWANSYNQEKLVVAAAKAMNNAVPIDPSDIDRTFHKGALDEDN